MQKLKIDFKRLELIKLILITSIVGAVLSINTAEARLILKSQPSMAEPIKTEPEKSKEADKSNKLDKSRITKPKMRQTGLDTLIEKFKQDNPTQNENFISGKGANVPLILAIKQIIGSRVLNYQNMPLELQTKLVNWQATNEHWQEVANSLLNPLGYGFGIKDNMVILISQNVIHKRLRVVSGESLIEIMKKASQEEGWQLIYDVPYNVIVQANAEFTGDFPKRVEQLIKSINGGKNSFVAEFYHGNRALRISTSKNISNK